MKKRQWKKLVRKMDDGELHEHLTYCENERKRIICECEFVRRNPELFVLEEWHLDELLQ